MNQFHRRIAPHVQQELQAAELAKSPTLAFQHLERAHVLGQWSTRHHVRVHWRMLQLGWRIGDWCEVRGQVTRLIGAASKTFLGWLPSGNTGVARVSAFQSMPIEPGLQALIEQAKNQDRFS